MSSAERIPKESIANQIILDSKIELLTRLLLEISSVDEVGAVSQKFTALIDVKLDKFSQIYNDFQITHEENQYADRRLEQKKEEIFKKMNTDVIRFFRQYIQRRTESDASECLFNYVQGLKDGIELYSQMEHAIKQGADIQPKMTWLFKPLYIEMDMYDLFLSRYGGIYHLKEMEENMDEMIFKADISDEYTEILTDYIDSEDVQQAKISELYKAGITQGLQLASDCFPLANQA